MMEAFQNKARAAIDVLKKASTKGTLIIFHDDADGLCSAAITEVALEREGFQTSMLCLEKLYSEIVQDVHAKDERIVFYVDIGSAHADMISECNNGRSLTIILDHHDPKPSKDPKVLDLNLEHFGFKGETDFSGATCCYLFARVLSKANVDLSYLALVGSLEIPEGFRALNETVLEEALKNRIIQKKGKSFEITRFKMNIDALFSKLQILGAAGYYESGPELGIKTCISGLSREAEEKIDVLENKRKEVNRRLLGRLYHERLRETKHIQWFDAGDMYAGMGTKVIGQFCSFLSYQTHLIKPNKYILGYVNVPPEIPKWGKLKESYVKASVRTPKSMQPLIDNGKLPGAVNLLDKASEGFGIADGHQYAASVIVPADKKQALIENAEQVINKNSV